MPAIKRDQYDRSKWESMNELASDVYKEKKDCAVKALAFAADVPYNKALDLLTKHGRTAGDRTYFHTTIAACNDLGYAVFVVPLSAFIRDYPKSHQVLKNVTTHHPDRFNKAWRDGFTYFMETGGHILTIKNGENFDWTRGRAIRAERVCAIIKNRYELDRLIERRGNYVHAHPHCGLAQRMVESCDD